MTPEMVTGMTREQVEEASNELTLRYNEEIGKLHMGQLFAARKINELSATIEKLKKEIETGKK